MAMEKRSEKCYFIYAQYLDQLMRDARQRQEGAPKSAGTGRVNPQDRLSGRSRCKFCQAMSCCRRLLWMWHEGYCTG